jgi:CRISPR associated protein Cas1
VKRLLNTLYVTTEGARLRKDGENLVAEIDSAERSRFPLHMLGSVVVFGGISIFAPTDRRACPRRDHPRPARSPGPIRSAGRGTGQRKRAVAPGTIPCGRPRGSVDRNSLTGNTNDWAPTVAPRAGSWIETAYSTRSRRESTCRSPRGSVDRNDFWDWRRACSCVSLPARERG